MVIAVFAMLLGLLLPSLAGARESAREAACASNLRQLQLASELYASDNQDRYMPGSADFRQNLHRWHGSRATESDPFHPAGGAITPYLSSTSDGRSSAAVRTCPSFARTITTLQANIIGFDVGSGGYGYNTWYVGTKLGEAGTAPDGRKVWKVIADQVGADRSLFASPGATLSFADAAFADGNKLLGIAEYSFIEPRFRPDSLAATRLDPSIHFRHAGAANAVWLDGHVSAEHMTFSWHSGYYAANPKNFRIGWMGESDSNTLFEYH